MESISKENIDTFVYGTYNEGYASRINYNNDNELQIISKDGIESYSFHIEELLQAWYLTEAAYTDNGSLKCYADIEMLSSLSMNNKGKLITICHTDWQSEQTCTHLLDMSYVSYDENGKIQNPEEVILATYEDITLSNSQYHIARNKGENAYYIDGIGRVIKEAYQSCTDFRNGYAMMIDPKGYVYIIDENFSQVAGGHSHSWGTHEVFRIGDAFCVDDGFQKIYLASPKK